MTGVAPVNSYRQVVLTPPPPFVEGREEVFCFVVILFSVMWCCFIFAMCSVCDVAAP
jgi:hypothetical protein